MIHYFTWPDGVFSYECRDCGICCKGLGIGLDNASGQLESLASHYPQIESFARLRGETWTLFNPRGRCWFLNEDGWCRVERDHGRDAKPAACRLFPFNRVFRLGPHTIVDFNAVICPLRAVGADATELQVGLSGRVTHASVMSDIEAIQDTAVIGTTLPTTGDDAQWLAFESSVAAACFAADATIQSALAAQSESADQDRVAVARAIAQVFQTDALEPTGDSLRHALFATPSLRFNECFGPRPYPAARLAAVLPRMWLAWLHLVATGENLAQRPLTLQEVTSMWSDVADLTLFIASWDLRLRLDPAEQTLPVGGVQAGRLIRFFQSLVENSGLQRTVGDSSGPLVADGTVAERVARCRLAGPVVRGALDTPPVVSARGTATGSRGGNPRKRRRR